MSTRINKEIFTSFVKRYNLNKTIEKAKIVCKDGTLSCNFNTMDQSNIGYLTQTNTGLPDFEFGVYVTSEMLNILNFLGDDVTLDFEMNSNNEISAFIMDDGENSVRYTTASVGIIDEVLELNSEPDYEIKINIDHNFVANYVGALSALPQTEFFTVVSNGKKTEILMNYNKEKSNIIKYKVDVVDDEHYETENEMISTVSFIKDVLTANKTFSDATMYLSKEGLLKLEINHGDFKGVYLVILQATKD